MKPAKSFIFVASFMALAACQAPPAPDSHNQTPPTQSSDGALTEREPDTCGATQYASAVGQPQSVIPTLGVTRKIRLVPPGSIISQQDYDAYRMNFYLDGAGAITRVTCG